MYRLGQHLKGVTMIEAAQQLWTVVGVLFSNIFLAFSGVRGHAVGRDDDIITTTHTYTATVHVITSIMGSGSGHTHPIPDLTYIYLLSWSPFSGGRGL